MKKIKYSVLTAIILLLASCNEKDTNLDSGISGDPVLTKFRITAPTTYAEGGELPGTEEENRIGSVELYIFDENGVRDESFNYHTATTVDGELEFYVNPGNKRVLLAVNTSLGERAGVGRTSMEELIDAVMLNNTNSQSMQAGKFVMSGKVDATIVEKRTDNEVTVKISRSVSKIEPPVANNVTVAIPNEDLQALFTDQTVTSADVTFGFNSYVVINGYSTSYIYTCYNDDDDEKGSTWSRWMPGGTYQKTTFDTNGEILVAYSGEKNGSAWLNDQNIFVYENQPVDSVDVAADIKGFTKNSVYAFLIQGTLTNAKDNQAFTRYWRVNLIRDDNYRIFRNTIYRVTLTEVRTTGYGTPKEAEEDEDNGKVVPDNNQTGIQATIDIVPWRIRTQQTDF